MRNGQSYLRMEAKVLYSEKWKSLSMGPRSMYDYLKLRYAENSHAVIRFNDGDFRMLMNCSQKIVRKAREELVRQEWIRAWTEKARGVSYCYKLTWNWDEDPYKEKGSDAK